MKKIHLLLIILFILIAFILMWNKFYLGMIETPTIILNGEEEITLQLGEEYIEKGCNASFSDKDITSDIKVEGIVDNKIIGEYTIKYFIKLNGKTTSKKRIITIVDKTPPELTLLGNSSITITEGTNYTEPGYKALDNYDGDITSKVTVETNLNNKVVGNYQLTYTIKDTSNNESKVVRLIIVKAKPKVTVVKPNNSTSGSFPSSSALATSIAVLNYHFFYDSNAGEQCNQSICISTSNFRKQLQVLKDNGYKTLTIKEFKAWMYGEISLPARSVLITVDDGALGTGLHNGNKLIPILEEFNMNATLFLITGWWNINNYRSERLDIQSHTNDMHSENYCGGVSRGAKMLCLDNISIINDLNASINVIGDNTAFCYPFYLYNSNIINILRQVGFKLAFAGGYVKATRNSSKYVVPRFVIYKSTTISQFINIIN